MNRKGTNKAKEEIPGRGQTMHGCILILLQSLQALISHLASDDVMKHGYLLTYLLYREECLSSVGSQDLAAVSTSPNKPSRF